MPLPPGSRLGPYEILAPLGAGGMGEVYRAHDPRLGREVALKVLPEGVSRDPDRLRRFEQEAKATSALSHPNLLTVFDTGSHGGVPYIVFELLEGSTLRARLLPGPLGSRKSVEYALQLASGLAAAHDKGLVHRDLKPENLFVTKDERVKVLDFGLARLRSLAGAEGVDSEVETASALTEPGTILGTVGYMSPEQVVGQPTDHRSDIFSFGAVLYEMLSGRRAFRGDSAAETMTAILKHDPPELAGGSLGVPLGLDRITRRCLEKDPANRFQSARDIGFALEAISAPSGASTLNPAARTGQPRRRLLLAALALLGLALLGAAYFLGLRRGERPLPTWQMLTFRRGIVGNARFASDGRTIVYGAWWDGGAPELFSTRAESTESRSLDIAADLVAISTTDEMALSLDRNAEVPYKGTGTLARSALAGGASREILTDVQGADWSPDGRELAVVHGVREESRLEWPIGTVLYKAPYLASPRVSPDGRWVAFLDGPGLSVMDRAGNRRQLTTDARAATPAWSPRGDEVWYASRDLRAVSLSGRKRLLARFPEPAYARVADVSRDGRALIVLSEVRSGIAALVRGETQERDLSWLSFSAASALSADGGSLLFSARGDCYLRRLRGSAPPVRLGEGFCVALSPDERWALVGQGDGFNPELSLLPTGAGASKVLKADGLEYNTAGWGQAGSWLPDGKQVVVVARAKGGQARSYLQPIDGGVPRALTPEGVVARPVSPNGRFVPALDAARNIVLYPVEGGDPRPVGGPAEPGELLGWTADGRGILVGEVVGPRMRILERDLAGSQRRLVKEIAPPDPAGIFRVRPLVSPDGVWYVYSYYRLLSNLYLVEGLE